MNTSRSLDFPIWMPSALVKELRQGLRTPSFILLVSIVPSLLSFFFLFSFIINPLDGEPFISPDGCQIIFLLFIMPLRASTSIRNELLTRNNELLLLTRQSAGRIVLGKWISFMAQSLLIAFISLPFFLIRYYYGEINLVQDVTLFFLLYLGSGMLTAYTLWASAMPSLMRIIAFSLMGIGILTLGGSHENLDFFAASILPLPFLENASGSIQNIMTGNSIFVMVYGISLMIINLNTPARLLPIHMEQMKNKRFSKLQQLLFLPGMPGSVLFTLLLCALAAIAVYLIDRMASIPEFQSPQRLFCLAAGGWYAITMPAMLLKPFWEKLKNNTLLTYTMICLILCLVQNVLWGVNLSVPLLPGGYLSELLRQETLPAFSKFSLFSLMDLAAGIAVLALTSKHWIDIFRNASPEPLQKPGNSRRERE